MNDLSFTLMYTLTHILPHTAGGAMVLERLLQIASSLHTLGIEGPRRITVRMLSTSLKSDKIAIFANKARFEE